MDPRPIPPPIVAGVQRNLRTIVGV